MAEEEPHSTEELQEADDPEETPGYVPPAKVSLDEIQNKDADDESLVRYKQALLGNVPKGATGDKNVVPVKMSMMVEGRPDVDVDLSDLTKLSKDTKIVMKEGIEYKIKFTFKVYNEITSGLRYYHSATRKGIKVDKLSLMMGSYGPKEEEQTYTTPPQDAPKGMIARGSYQIQSKITDDDKSIHGEWTWTIDVKKDWE